ncbi:DUF3219 family protein [Alkalihalobacillus deserti]|uniref:DUF3219 family protein n=1 Tax=Alkalihalobacillus deserti TaxID=2879466 RepID=UPI001D13AB27|nr:DUF3219 family protein [Alkalihalobacillus deserti]
MEVLRYHDTKTGFGENKMVIDFQVSSEDYYRITTLLYEMTFDVKVAERNLDSRATISNYSTSFTNLYEENQVGVFHLELIEVRK